MAQELLSFKIGDGFEAEFLDWDSLIEWIGKERAQWDWLSRGDGFAGAHSWASAAANQWEGILTSARQFRAQAQPIARASEILHPLVQQDIFTSFSEKGKLVLDVRESAGDIAAAFAYAFMKHAVTWDHIRGPEALVGVLLTALPDLREPSEISAHLKRERRNYREAINSAIARANKHSEALSADFLGLVHRGKLVGFRRFRRRLKAWEKVATDWKQIADKSVAEINDTRATFVEFMGLRAPVDYWKRKASAHGDAAGTAAERLALFFIALTIVLGTAFIVAAKFILWNSISPNQTPPGALYVVISAGLAVLSTIGFWIGRILSRLYLSEHRMKTDADERAVMTETYLALTEAGKATDVERQIILSALFRNTTDGTVKDDGPPDLGLQAIASRYLSQK